MDESNECIIEWSYTPYDFFEQSTSFSLTVRGRDYTLLVGSGKAKVAIGLEFYVSEEFRKTGRSILNELTMEVDRRCRGVELWNFVPYHLSAPNIILPPNYQGSRVLFAEPATMYLGTGNVVLHALQGSGWLQQRLSEMRYFAEFVARYIGRHSTVDKMFLSLRAASRDPENEFLHLYEVLDALNAYFPSRSKKQICTEIGLDHDIVWKRLGNITNDKKYKQSRHRGSHSGESVNASNGLLEEARKLARKVIVTYVNYLESKSLI
jgi:hypothetical protein